MDMEALFAEMRKAQTGGVDFAAEAAEKRRRDEEAERRARRGERSDDDSDDSDSDDGDVDESRGERPRGLAPADERRLLSMSQAGRERGGPFVAGQNAVCGAAVASPRRGPVCSAPPGRRCRRRCVLCCHDAANAALRHRSNACSSGVGAAERAVWGDWAGAWAPLPGSRHAMHTLQFSGLAAASRWRAGGGCRRTRGAAAGTGDRRVDARHGAAADYA